MIEQRRCRRRVAEPYDEVVRAHLASLVEDFRKHSDEKAVAVHRGNRCYRTTYGELAQIAGRFAAGLEQRGVRPGERVVLWGVSSAEWVGAFFGCLLRGVIAVPLDAAGSPEFANRVVEDVKPRLIAGDWELLRTLTTSTAQLVFSEMAAELPAEPLFAVSEAVNAQAAFQIVFTSGTTSEPKGIVHTHRNVLASLQPIENEIGKYLKYERWFHPLRFLHNIPLSHVFGQFMGLWVPPLIAAEVHFGDRLHPARTIDLIHGERISVLVSVPRVLQLLRAHLLRRFESLEHELEQAKEYKAWQRWWRFRKVHRALGFKFWAVISGGATLPEELESFWNGLGFALIQGYGMTETAALVTLNHPFHIGRGTIGRPLPGREVRIRDDGEIEVRGEMLSGATWQGGAMRAREGEWLATGDLAAKNEAGELTFLGRKGDVIVTSAGMNVYPADLEAAMMKRPGLRGCVVVPCNTAAGTEPTAVVIFSGSDGELQEVVREANRELAEYQSIRRVLKWPELRFPYTSTGKLLRREVERWACGAIANGTVSSPRGKDVLLNVIGEITGERAAGDGDGLRLDGLRLSEDLRLDSLGRVQLQSMLEQELGVELEEDTIARMETLGELRAVVGHSVGVTDQMSSVETEVAEKPAELEHTYPRWPWSWSIQMLRAVFIETVMRTVTWMLAAPKVTGETDKLPPGPVLVIANHISAYDGALVLHALPPRLRQHMAIAMSGETLMNFRRARNQRSAFLNLLAPAAYWLVTALFNTFPLPRLRGFRQSFAHAGEAMDRGYSVMVFPEGERSRDGKMHAFRPGIGLLAQESRVPVVPVALVGLYEMRERKVRWFRSGRMEVRVGRAIPVNQSAIPEELTAQFEEGLRRLLAESR